jgi:hypothetical protein
MSIELTKKGKVVVIGLACIGVVMLWLFASSSVITNPGDGSKPGTITGFYRIDGQYGDHLINVEPNLLVVDANKNSTNYLHGFMVTKAIWSTDPSMFYNSQKPIMVYSTPDDAAAEYCTALVGKVYGQVYMMRGGYEGWYSWVHRNDV